MMRYTVIATLYEGLRGVNRDHIHAVDHRVIQTDDREEAFNVARLTLAQGYVTRPAPDSFTRAILLGGRVLSVRVDDRDKPEVAP